MSPADLVGSDDLRRRAGKRAALAAALLVALAGGCAVAPVAPEQGPVATSPSPKLPPANELAESLPARPPVPAAPPPGAAPVPVTVPDTLRPADVGAIEPPGPTVMPASATAEVGQTPRPEPVTKASVAHPAISATPSGPAAAPAPAPVGAASGATADGPGGIRSERQLEPESADLATQPPGWEIPDRPEIAALLEEFTGPRRPSIGLALQRADAYLPMIQRVLEEEGLPRELAYLPMVESHYLPHAESPAGAVGLWQFIATTAQGSGLRVDWWVDERLDPELATRAAARHLRELYERFADWELALAAYNAGPGGVAGALGRSGADGFWELAAGGWLRAETRRYLPKFYASLSIARDPVRFGFTAGGAGPPRGYDTVMVTTPVDLHTVARAAGLVVADLQRLNPGLKRLCTPPGCAIYPLRVPAGKGAQVAARLEELGPEERTDFLRYRVRAGDTLWGIARRFDTRPTAISELNDVTDPRRLRPGQQLVVPARQVRQQFKTRGKEADRTAGTEAYHVRPGDTVAAIARVHGVAVADVLRWNGLGSSGLIRPGDRLVIRDTRAGLPSGLGRSRVHVVEDGDTLWGISRRYGVSLQELRRTNALEQGAVLRPGDELAVDLPQGAGG